MNAQGGHGKSGHGIIIGNDGKISIGRSGKKAGGRACEIIGVNVPQSSGNIYPFAEPLPQRNLHQTEGLVVAGIDVRETEQIITHRVGRRISGDGRPLKHGPFPQNDTQTGLQAVYPLHSPFRHIPVPLRNSGNFPQHTWLGFQERQDKGTKHKNRQSSHVKSIKVFVCIA